MTEHGEGLQRVDHGFGPLYDHASRILFLGTMASPASRSQGFFYMHPRNRFWPVMEALFADPDDPADRVGASVQSRRAFALRHHIALWDAIESCDIRHASDASIRNVVPSDLAPIITGSRVNHIYTCGAKLASDPTQLTGRQPHLYVRGEGHRALPPLLRAGSGRARHHPSRNRTAVDKPRLCRGNPRRPDRHIPCAHRLERLPYAGG